MKKKVKKMMSDKRVSNVINRMIDGDVFWSSGFSPRLTLNEFRFLEKIGFAGYLQGEKGWGDVAGGGPTLFCLINRDRETVSKVEGILEKYLEKAENDEKTD